jgi:hypothetical protein
VTNPFYFEDPRALTEARLIYIFQDTPSGNPVFKGGDINYFGAQFRLALTDRLSLVITKLGWIWMDPKAPVPELEGGNGFSEVHFGAKYTFLRNECSGTLMAAGLNLEVPSGPERVGQDTGDLSLVPYVSFGQYFGRTLYGGFHFLNTTGYSIRTDSTRTEFFFSSFHLDFDVGNLHRIYPFVELNWFLYARGGDARNFDFEGRDLANLGSRFVGGDNELTIAVGARYKFTEVVQAGAAVEFPLLDNRGLLDFRLTFDLIFRY